MAVPKYKTSKAHTKSRFAQTYKTQAPTLVQCNHCSAFTRPHFVCNSCGFYNGVEVISPKAKKQKDTSFSA